MVTPQRARFLSPGDKLGKYDLIRQIAVGGMAELYLARTVGIEGFEKLVVVKRILPQYSDNASFVTMFLNEARLAATLGHPNIAQVYDIGQDAGDYFFAMEYVHGEDLGRLVSAAHDSGVPMSLDVALTLVAGLCAGLHYAHEKASPDGKPLGVVHRDVSPSNVLVSYDGTVKLVDFGIARVGNTPSSTQGGLKGKIGYMSPEQCRGKIELDRRSDIFSVGTILYELTTGQMPFTDETEYGVLNQIVNNDVARPSAIVPDFPPALEAIVLRALARDREQRYASAMELQTAVEDFAHENRLRVSPLVVARLMGALFPQRLEEWDHARAQGAFFVEQHVLRTLIESGKTGDITLQGPPLAPPVTTRVGAPPPPPLAEDETTAVTSQIVSPPLHAVTVDTEPTAVVSSLAPPSDVISNAEPRELTPIPVSIGYAVDVVAQPQGRVVDRGETALVTIGRPRRWPLVMALVFGGAAAAAGVTYFVLDRSDATAAAADPSGERARPHDPSTAAPTESEPGAVTANQPAAATPETKDGTKDGAKDDAQDAVPSATPAETVKSEAVAPAVAGAPKVGHRVPADPKKVTAPKPDPKRIAVRPKPRPTKVDPPKPRPTKPEPAEAKIDPPKPKPPVKPDPPEAKPEPKEPTWQPDSPFMPVRPDKH